MSTLDHGRRVCESGFAGCARELGRGAWPRGLAIGPEFARLRRYDS